MIDCPTLLKKKWRAKGREHKEKLIYERVNLD